MEKQLVTDTHPLIYFFCGKGTRLGKKARQAYQDAVSGKPTVIFVPAPVLWELSMLVQEGEIKLNQPFANWVDELFRYTMLIPCVLDQEIVKELHNVNYHNDPFDRAIVATALHLGLPLISNDSKMHSELPCNLLWD